MPRARPTLLLLLLLVLGGRAPPAAGAQQAPTEPEQPTEAGPARAFWLEQNYPNPINPETWIPFHLRQEVFAEARPVVVSIRIYNILRQLVAIPTAVDYPGRKTPRVAELPYGEPGRKVAYWDGKDLKGRRVPSGIYYCELVVNDESDFIRLVVVTRKSRIRFLPRF